MIKLNRCSIYVFKEHFTDIITIDSSSKNYRQSVLFSKASVLSSIKCVLAFMCLLLSFDGKSQSFEISSNVCDSLAPNSFAIHLSGYATFSDSMEIEVNLLTADSVNTIVYSGTKDFSAGGASNLINFTFDPLTELFSLDIGNYTTRDYIIHLVSKENGVLKEELFIDTF